MQVVHKNQSTVSEFQPKRENKSALEEYANQDLWERYKKAIDMNMELYDAAENHKKLCLHLLGFVSKLGEMDNFFEFYQSEEIKRDDKARRHAIASFKHPNFKDKVKNPYY